MAPPLKPDRPWVMVMPEMLAVTSSLIENTTLLLLPLSVRALGPVTPGPMIVSGTLVLYSLRNVKDPLMARVMVCGVEKTPVVSNMTTLGVLLGTSGLLLLLAHSIASRSVPIFEESPTRPPMKLAVTILSELASQAPMSGIVPALAMLPGPVEAPRTAPRSSMVTPLAGSPLLRAGLLKRSDMVWVGPP